MPDAELDVELKPDEEALENIEEKQLEITGEPDSVSDAKEMNEEQNEQLSIMGRTMGRILSVARKFAPLLLLIAAVVKVLADAFDISFEDVRDAIVSALNQLATSIIDAIRSFLPGNALSETTGLTETQGNRAAGTLLGAPFGPAGLIGGDFIGQSDQQRQDTQEQASNIMLSPFQILGDSTFQELQSQVNEEIILEGGS